MSPDDIAKINGYLRIRLEYAARRDGLPVVDLRLQDIATGEWSEQFISEIEDIDLIIAALQTAKIKMQKSLNNFRSKKTTQNTPNQGKTGVRDPGKNL